MSVEFLKSYNLSVPNWQACLENFNNSVVNGGLIKHNCLGFFVSHEAHTISEVEKVLADLNLVVAHLYMNITISGGSFGNHKDEDEVCFWQVQGKTKWIIEEQMEYVLGPGDLIIIPKNTYHNVIPLGPRAGISMSF